MWSGPKFDSDFVDTRQKFGRGDQLLGRLLLEFAFRINRDHADILRYVLLSWA